MRVILVGNYGVGNLGDEALREYFLRTFPDIDWQVVSAHPETGEFERMPCGIRSLFTTSWGRTLKAFRNADAVVFGGGSLFTDTESVNACWIWWWHAVWARFFGKPVLLAFQGIGPFHTKIGERLARNVCENAAFISVRDAVSKQRADSWGLNRNIIQSFDPVFSLIEANNEATHPKNLLTLIPRKNSGTTFRDVCQKIVQEHQNSAVTIVLLQPDDPEEKAQGAALQSLFPNSIVRPVKTLSELTNELRSASHVVTERFHAGLLAFGLGCPLTVVSQKEGDKLSELRVLVESGADPVLCLQKVKDGEVSLKEALRKLQ